MWQIIFSKLNFNTNLDGKSNQIRHQFVKLRQKYNLRLREPLWPCAIQNKRVKLELQQPPEESACEGGSETTFAGLQSTHFRKQKSAIRELYYPLELLRILPGQRVNDAKQKQGDGLKSKMIKCCQERVRCFVVAKNGNFITF